MLAGMMWVGILKRNVCPVFVQMDVLTVLGGWKPGLRDSK